MRRSLRRAAAAAAVCVALGGCGASDEERAEEAVRQYNAAFAAGDGEKACALHPRLNSDLLFAAALLHDVGKTREFTLGAEIALSDEGRLVGHLALGQQMVAERVGAIDGFPREKALALLHCLLGHHGPDALPGRRFASAEALALYRLNAVDAAVKGALEHGLA